MTPEEPPVNPPSAAGRPVAPAAPEAAPEFPSALPPPPERDPFWGYSDLLWLFGLAIASVLSALAVERIALKLFKLEVASIAAGMLVLYGLLCGSLRMMFRLAGGG